MTHAHKNRCVLRLSAFAVFFGLALACSAGGDVVVYNHSPSMQIGFYARIAAPIRRGTIVTVRAAAVAPEYARMRHFNGPRDRFIKRVVGTSGDLVCAAQSRVMLNGALVAHRQNSDSLGRRLPTWTGCITLGAGDVFLLGDGPDSFDGRYWGVVRMDQIEGVWRPLLVKSADAL